MNNVMDKQKINTHCPLDWKVNLDQCNATQRISAIHYLPCKPPRLFLMVPLNGTLVPVMDQPSEHSPNTLPTVIDYWLGQMTANELHGGSAHVIH